MANVTGSSAFFKAVWRFLVMFFGSSLIGMLSGLCSALVSFLFFHLFVLLPTKFVGGGVYELSRGWLVCVKVWGTDCLYFKSSELNMIIDHVC